MQAGGKCDCAEPILRSELELRGAEQGTQLPRAQPALPRRPHLHRVQLRVIVVIMSCLPHLKHGHLGAVWQGTH